MSDEKDPKTNLRVLEFERKKESSESNKIVADMFRTLAKRADAGDIEDFVITFKSESRGIESMIGAGRSVRGFDFIGYIGMLEVLKQRLLGIMSQMTYAYTYEGEEKEEPKQSEDKDGQPTEPEST